MTDGSPANTSAFPAGIDLRLPIGVFDSGVGGLTVLRALRERLPDERFLYLGDTARLPYGTKSGDSVLRYSIQAAQFLVQRGIKYLVIACNTASSVAVEALRQRFAPIPVIGVIEPGAVAGCASSRSGQIGVIATEGTVQGGAYQQAIGRIRPEFAVVAEPCSLFVSLAEEGWTDGPIVEAIVHRYLDPMFAAHPQLDTLLLGCTHFPLLLEALRAAVDPRVAIVDSAATTAEALAADLARRKLGAPGKFEPAISLMATDGPQRFARVGSRFLGRPVDARQVELVDLVR
ncbi:glutamate racemase [Povalibacter sp.]|uniref:glutamate racemase n=1 Tax=Povalibacter sp. TaxID=1962978 RepID=UPI002F4005EE